jgi:uncharacterized paraquat-inducible protein A
MNLGYSLLANCLFFNTFLAPMTFRFALSIVAFCLSFFLPTRVTTRARMKLTLKKSRVSPSRLV